MHVGGPGSRSQNTSSQSLVEYMPACCPQKRTNSAAFDSQSASSLLQKGRRQFSHPSFFFPLAARIRYDPLDSKILQLSDSMTREHVVQIVRRLCLPGGVIACVLYFSASLSRRQWVPVRTVASSPAAKRTAKTAAARSAYSAKVAEKYNDHFSKDAHFLPSLMTTDTGEFIDPKDFPTAQYCGHCHQEAQHQWRQTAHSNSNRAPWYLRNVNLLNVGKGVEYSRHCEGCHDPVALVAGNLTQGSTKRRPFDADGVTCAVCHSIQKIDTRGTGSYVLGIPAVLVDEDGKPITRPVSDAEIPRPPRPSLCRGHEAFLQNVGVLRHLPQGRAPAVS